jgi:hypothetical protein
MFIKIILFTLSLFIWIDSLFACDVLTNKAQINELSKEYIIPVSVNKNSECIVFDKLNDKSNLNNIWVNLEKIMLIKNNQFGKFKRIYKLSGENLIKDYYLYKASSKEGTEDIIFKATIAPSDAKYNKIVFRVTVK